MSRVLTKIPRAVAAAAAFCFAAHAAADEIGIEDLADLPAADVLVIGEIHDNPEHHIAQAEAIFALRPPAVVFEMLSDAQARAIRPDMMRDADALERAIEWADSGWPSFDMYYPVFLASEGALIYGAAAPREEVRAATQDGAAAVFGGAAPLFRLDRVLDDREQLEREARQQSAHCDAMPFAMLPGMVEAQRLRDAYLARAVLAAFLETGGPVVLITGNGHAQRDWGAPALLLNANPELNILTIGQFEAEPEGPIAFDYWLITDPVERTDPCEEFR